MYVCMYVYIVIMYVQYVCICMYVFMYACIYMYSVQIRTSMSVCLYECMYVCKYVCSYVCMYVCIITAYCWGASMVIFSYSTSEIPAAESGSDPAAESLQRVFM